MLIWNKTKIRKTTKSRAKVNNKFQRSPLKLRIKNFLKKMSLSIARLKKIPALIIRKRNSMWTLKLSKKKSILLKQTLQIKRTTKKVKKKPKSNPNQTKIRTWRANKITKIITWKLRININKMNYQVMRHITQT